MYENVETFGVYRIDENSVNLGPYILAICIVVSLFLSTFSLSYFHIGEIEAAQMEKDVEDVGFETIGDERHVYVDEGADAVNTGFGRIKTGELAGR